MVNSLDAVMVAQPTKSWSWLLSLDGGTMILIFVCLWFVFGLVTASLHLKDVKKDKGHIPELHVALSLPLIMLGMLSFVAMLLTMVLPWLTKWLNDLL